MENVTGKFLLHEETSVNGILLGHSATMYHLLIKSTVFKTRIYIKGLGKHLEVELLNFTTSSSQPGTPPTQQTSGPAVDAIVIPAITL